MNLWFLCIPQQHRHRMAKTGSVLWAGAEVGKDRPGPLCKVPLSLPCLTVGKSHMCARRRNCSFPEAARETGAQSPWHCLPWNRLGDQ